MTENVKHVEVLQAMRTVFANIPAPCHERDALDAAIERLQREAAGDGEVNPADVERACVAAWGVRESFIPSVWEDYRSRMYRALKAIAGAPRPTGTEPMRAHYEDQARKQGWSPDDGEGAVEYLMRRCYETGHEDAVNQRSTHGPHTTPASAEPGEAINAMVDRFLAWPLPSTVCVDVVASYYPPHPYPRTGTCLLSAVEARAMLEHVIGPLLHEEYQSGYEEGLRDNPDARGGGEAELRIGATRNYGDGAWFREFTIDGITLLAELNHQDEARHLLGRLLSHPTPAALDAESRKRAFQPGNRVEWQDNFGEWHAAKVTKVHDRVTTYTARLDDGTEAVDYPASRFRDAASATTGGHGNG